MLFGPAYKGIPLAAALSIAFADVGRTLNYSFNRKEEKDHGEGGSVIGAKLAGRVLIIDDVISAGTSVRESVAIIKAAGATPCGVAIALDRMERGTGSLSAVQEVKRDYNMPVMGGIAFIHKMRAKPDCKFTPILVLTTETEESRKNEAKAAGATGWLVKPFDPSRLIQVVNRLVPCIEDPDHDH